MNRIALAILALAHAPASATALPLPACAAQVQMTNVHVARVDRDGALVLAHDVAWLEGIRLVVLDDPSAAIAARTLAEVRRLAMTVPLTLTAAAPLEDRYRRLRVQAFGTVWLQLALLREGLARVAIAPDREACAADFFGAEAEARRAKRGMWAIPRYQVQKAQSVSVSQAGRFELVEGKIKAVSTHGSRTFLDFDRDYRNGLSAVIGPGDRRKFRKARLALKNLTGRDIRIRGIVENFGGRLEIILSSPYQIELPP
ncbi:MAG: thermonuclease family protein [Rhizomicrobium sp.]